MMENPVFPSGKRSKWILLSTLPLMISACVLPLKAQSGRLDLVPEHVSSRDFEIMEEAFLHGYAHNIVHEQVDGRRLPTLTIQCTSEGRHVPEGQLKAGRPFFSVWTRDLYWGFLGWVQAGDDRVLEMMKSSIELLILAKKRNRAEGQSRLWPLADGRCYVPQAYTTGLRPALDFYPWCSESQADFLLLAHHYWEQSGDTAFIRTIWEDLRYVTETLELLDTDGNTLPDDVWGSYDYMWIKPDSEEPLMCAKTGLAYQSVARLARELKMSAYAAHLDSLAAALKRTMNRSVDEGGLWKEEEGGGHFIQMRRISPPTDTLHERFIPYNNLVPMWCGMTNQDQDRAIFSKLDEGFENYYDLVYGPMYCAPAGQNEKSVMECSSVTWLAFLDVFLRGKKGHLQNRNRIYEMLVEHAGDAGGIPFPEGAGVYGYLTGGAGRSWDNGNYFHMLVCGVYGLEKDRHGIRISPPRPIRSHPVTELRNVSWRRAVYHFQWKGQGEEISRVWVDGQVLPPGSGGYRVAYTMGRHEVMIELK